MGKIDVDRLKVLASQMEVERSVICFILPLERKSTDPVLSQNVSLRYPSHYFFGICFVADFC